MENGFITVTKIKYSTSNTECNQKVENAVDGTASKAKTHPPKIHANSLHRRVNDLKNRIIEQIDKGLEEQECGGDE